VNRSENPGNCDSRCASRTTGTESPALVNLVGPSQTETLPAFLCPLLLFGSRGTEAGGHAYVSREGRRDTQRAAAPTSPAALDLWLLDCFLPPFRVARCPLPDCCVLLLAARQRVLLHIDHDGLHSNHSPPSTPA
jgi:hypothetical protein